MGREERHTFEGEGIFRSFESRHSASFEHYSNFNQAISIKQFNQAIQSSNSIQQFNPEISIKRRLAIRIPTVLDQNARLDQLDPPPLTKRFEFLLLPPFPRLE